MYAVSISNHDGCFYAEVCTTEEKANEAEERIRRTRGNARLLKMDLEWINVIEFEPDSEENILSDF